MVFHDDEELSVVIDPSADASSRNDAALHLPEVQRHRLLIQASVIVRRDLGNHLQHVIPEDIWPLVDYAMSRPDMVIDRDAAARMLGMSRRTLHNRLAEHGLPSPRRFLIWVRLLIAAGLLDHGFISVERVAWHLGFSDGMVLAKTLRRYTGTSTRALRLQGALRTALARLFTASPTPPTPALAAPASPAPAAPGASETSSPSARRRCP